MVHVSSQDVTLHRITVVFHCDDPIHDRRCRLSVATQLILLCQFWAHLRTPMPSFPHCTCSLIWRPGHTGLTGLAGIGAYAFGVWAMKRFRRPAVSETEVPA